MFRWTVRALAFAMFAMYGRSAWSMQADLGVGLGVGHSDNINLVPENPTDTWLETAVARLDATEHRSDMEGRIRGTAEYRDYQTSLYSNELLFSFDSAGIWILDPGRTTWAAEDYFRQASINAFEPPTPANRQNVNAFSTGPEATWRLSRRSTVVAGGRYANFYYERSDADSQRWSAYGRAQYGMSPRTDVSANVELAANDFYSSNYSDFDTTDGFLRLNHRWARSTVELDAGSTYIRRQNLENVDGFLGRADWHMDFNSYSGIEASYDEELTDAGHDILQRASAGEAIGYLNQQVTGDVFYTQTGSGAYHWQGLRTSLRISGSSRKENYKTTPNDRKLKNGDVGLGYELTPTLRAVLSGYYERAEYLQTGQINNDKRGGLRFDYRINSHVYASADYTRTQRNSNFDTADFTENRVMFTLWYQEGTSAEIGNPFGNEEGLLLHPKRPLLDEGRVVPPVREE